MKGPKHKELIELTLMEFPCEFCDAHRICNKECMYKKSLRTFLRRIGKTKTAELRIRLERCTTKSSAYELINQYNQ